MSFFFRFLFLFYLFLQVQNHLNSKFCINQIPSSISKYFINNKNKNKNKIQIQFPVLWFPILISYTSRFLCKVFFRVVCIWSILMKRTLLYCIWMVQYYSSISIFNIFHFLYFNQNEAQQQKKGDSRVWTRHESGNGTRKYRSLLRYFDFLVHFGCKIHFNGNVLLQRGYSYLEYIKIHLPYQWRNRYFYQTYILKHLQ